MDTEYQPVEITGIRYIPIDVIVVNQKQAETAEAAIAECCCVRQRVKELHGGFLGMSPTYAILTYLVPEQNVQKFNRIVTANEGRQ